MRRDENGYIVVETIGSFLLFVLLVISILSLINIVTVQSRVHYALTQTAGTLSMYCYTLEVTGIADPMTHSAGKAEHVEAEADRFKSNLNGIVSGLKELDADKTSSSGKDALNQVQGWVGGASDDPMGSLQYLINYGLQREGSKLLNPLLRPLMKRYLTNGSMSGEEYLEAFHVIGGLDGLDFGDAGGGLFSSGPTGSRASRLLTGDGEVKLVVQYDIDYTFGALIFPFKDHKLHVTQGVMTKAWLGGKGEGYKG